MEQLEKSCQNETRIKMRELIYSGYEGAKVPSFLLSPFKGSDKTLPGTGKSILFLHPASGDRRTLVEEAKAMAEIGFTVLIPDAPFHRPEFSTKKFSSDGDRRQFIYRQWIEDCKLGLSLLLEQESVDTKTQAVIGRNLGGGMATIIASQARVAATVVIGAIPSLARSAAKNIPACDHRSFEQVYSQLLPYDPIAHVPGVAGKLFLQYGRYDDFFTISEAEEFIHMAPVGTKVKWYEEGHSLQSRKVCSDYLNWIRQVL